MSERSILGELGLHHLRALDAILRLGNVTRAAESLGVSQSALSHQLVRLRAVLEDPLFVREGRGVKPTAMAEALMPAVREALDKVDGIEVVRTLNTGTDPQEIYAAIENAMLSDPGITGILSLECCSTPAAGEWVKRNGQAGKVKVVGFDLLDQTVDLVADDVIQVTIDQAPARQGFEAVNLLVEFLNGKTIDDLDTGVGIYTPENIKEAM